MVERGVGRGAMEVSSHALALGRVAGTRYDVAVFTNLSQDHLDFHARPGRLLRGQGRAVHAPATPRRGVVNIDDPRGRELAAEPQLPITTFSAEGRRADWRAVDVRTGADGSTFRVIGPGGVAADAQVALPGAFNVANALGAIVALVEAGIGLATAVAGVAACPGVPGRLERVEAGQDFTVLVDYSHKPGAVEAVLTGLRQVTLGSLTIVLGCGGDRDSGKRPLMGAAGRPAGRHRDLHQRQPALGGPAGHPGRRCWKARSRWAWPGAREVIIQPDRAAAIDAGDRRGRQG